MTAEAVDVAASVAVKEFLRTHSPHGLELPQVWVGRRFVGLHGEFENAVEGGYLDSFLGQA